LLLVIVSIALYTSIIAISQTQTSFESSIGSLDDISALTNEFDLGSIEELMGIDLFDNANENIQDSITDSCKEIQRSIDVLNNRIVRLQDELQTAPTNAKPELVQLIREVREQISDAKDLLRECEDKPNDVPSRVTGLSARAVGSNQIDLSWNQNPDSEAIQHYNVYRSKIPGFTVNTATDVPIFQPTSNSYSDTGLDSATTYYYKVAAVNSNGIGPVSDEFSATTGGQPNAVDPALLLDLGYEQGENRTGYEWGGAQYQENPIDEESRLVQVDKTAVSSNNEGDTSGDFALRTTVKEGDIATNPQDSSHTSHGNRAEVVHLDSSSSPTDPYYYFREGDDMWFHWYTLFPSSGYPEIVVPSGIPFDVWTQWHPSDNCQNTDGTSCKVNVAFAERDSRLFLQVLFEDKWTDTEPLRYDHWYEMLVHIKWSNDPGKGFIELWQDGKRVGDQTLDRTKPMKTLEDDGVAYMKQGLYRSPNAENTQTVYHDGMVVASCPGDQYYYHPDTGKCHTDLPYS